MCRLFAPDDLTNNHRANEEPGLHLEPGLFCSKCEGDLLRRFAVALLELAAEQSGASPRSARGALDFGALEVLSI
jgi:hypothetical protein